MNDEGKSMAMATVVSDVNGPVVSDVNVHAKFESIVLLLLPKLESVGALQLYMWSRRNFKAQTCASSCNSSAKLWVSRLGMAHGLTTR